MAHWLKKSQSTNKRTEKEKNIMTNYETQKQEYIIELKNRIRKQEEMISYLEKRNSELDKKKEEISLALHNTYSDFQQICAGTGFTSYAKTVGSNKFRVNTYWNFKLRCFSTNVWAVTENKEDVKYATALWFNENDPDLVSAAKRHQDTVENLKNGWSLLEKNRELAEELIRKDHITTANNNSIVVITSRVKALTDQSIAYHTRCYFGNEDGDAFVCSVLGSSDISMSHEKFTSYYNKWVSNHEEMLAKVRADF